MQTKFKTSNLLSFKKFEIFFGGLKIGTQKNQPEETSEHQKLKLTKFPVSKLNQMCYNVKTKWIWLFACSNKIV